MVSTVPLLFIDDPIISINFSSTSSTPQYHGLVKSVSTDVAKIDSQFLEQYS